MCVVATLSFGCRSAVPALSSAHILRDRTSGSGSPAFSITRAERMAGRVEARSEYLGSLRDRLRQVRFTAGLFGTVRVGVALSAAGRVQSFDPTTNSFGSPDPTDLAAGFDVPRFRADYGTMCTSALFGSAFPPINGSCDPLGGADRIRPWLDDLDITAVDADIDVRWEAPATGTTCTPDRQVANCLGRCQGSNLLCARNEDCPGAETCGPISCSATPAACDVVGGSSICPEGYACTGGSCIWARPCSTPEPSGAPSLECTEDARAGTGFCVAGSCTMFTRATCTPGDAQDRPRFITPDPTDVTIPPVLVVDVPLLFDPDPQDLLGIFIDVQDSVVDLQIRAQVNGCDGTHCNDGAPMNGARDGQTIFTQYRSLAPGADVVMPDVGIGFTFRATVRGGLSVAPTPGCEIAWEALAPFLGLPEAILSPLGLGHLPVPIPIPPPGSGLVGCTFAAGIASTTAATQIGALGNRLGSGIRAITRPIVLQSRLCPNTGGGLTPCSTADLLAAMCLPGSGVTAVPLCNLATTDRRALASLLASVDVDFGGGSLSLPPLPARAPDGGVPAIPIGASGGVAGNGLIRGLAEATPNPPGAIPARVDTGLLSVGLDLSNVRNTLCTGGSLAACSVFRPVDEAGMPLDAGPMPDGGTTLSAGLEHCDFCFFCQSCAAGTVTGPACGLCTGPTVTQLPLPITARVYRSSPCRTPRICGRWRTSSRSPRRSCAAW